MAEGFQGYIITMLIFGLFVISLITTGIMIADQNDATQSIGDDPSISEYKSSIENNLTTAYNDVSSSNTVIENSSITTTTSIPIFTSVQSIWKTIKKVPITVYNLTIGLAMKKLFGDSAGIVTAVISTILILLILFAVIKWVATGIGDQ